MGSPTTIRPSNLTRRRMTRILAIRVVPPLEIRIRIIKSSKGIRLIKVLIMMLILKVYLVRMLSVICITPVCKTSTEANPNNSAWKTRPTSKNSNSTPIPTRSKMRREFSKQLRILSTTTWTKMTHLRKLDPRFLSFLHLYLRKSKSGRRIWKLKTIEMTSLTRACLDTSIPSTNKTESKLKTNSLPSELRNTTKRWTGTNRPLNTLLPWLNSLQYLTTLHMPPFHL